MKKMTMAWALGLGWTLAVGVGADEANTFALTHVTNGTDWVLIDVPATVKMSDHVGHKVEVSGTTLAAGDKTADEKGISSGTGSGARAPVAKPASQEDKGVSSGTGSGAAKMKSKKEGRRLKVTSMKHVAATCP